MSLSVNRVDFEKKLEDLEKAMEDTELANLLRILEAAGGVIDEYNTHLKGDICDFDDDTSDKIKEYDALEKKVEQYLEEKEQAEEACRVAEEALEKLSNTVNSVLER